jgi:glycerophosphoryl diester phosphodiesterase
LDVLERYEVPVMYIPIVKNERELNRVLNRAIKTVGAELIIESEQSDFNNAEIIKQLKKRDILIWLNAIRLNDTITLTLGSDDDLSFLKNEDEWWGKILDMGH